MENLFDKAIVFTDIHFGKKHNSPQFNQDCLDFIDWMCDIAKPNDIKTCIFMGDWHDNRNAINVQTLNYTVDALRVLNEVFNDVYFIIGNHDLFYRDKREIHSLPMGLEFNNIHMINDITTIGNVTLSPWLVENEWKNIQKLKSKYLFGHFEIPGFMLNAQVEMPDHGEINRTHFKNQDYVFSGHFHKRQSSENIHYIGNPFGHNYSDSMDFDRGCMTIEWDNPPVYHNWTDGPKYISSTLSKIIASPEKYLLPKSYIKCETDIDVTYEESIALRESLLTDHSVREFKLIKPRNTEHTEDTNETIKFDTVDEIVLDQIKHMEDGKLDKKILMSIYNGI